MRLCKKTGICILQKSKQMKKLFLVIAASLMAINVWAKCAGSGFSFFPAGPEISSNPLIVIDGYAASQQAIRDLATKHPAWLVSGRDRVRLIVQETLEGQYMITQALLHPERPLQKGLIYELEIDGMSKKEEKAQLRRYDKEKNEWGVVKWKVANPKDDSPAPEWISAPVKTGEQYSVFGCGPAMWVNFQAGIKSNGEYLVKAVVKEKHTGKELSWYLPVINGEIKLGHGMCSGAFRFVEKGSYSVYFQIVDNEGHRSAASEQPIDFNAPKMS